MSVFTNDVVIDSGVVTVDTITNPVTVSGTVTANAGTGTMLVDGSAHTQPVSGTVTANAGTGTMLVDGSAHTQPISGTVSVGNVVSVITAVASSATLTVVSQSNTTDTLLLATNANRKSAIIFLPKTATSVAYDSTASASHFTYKTGAANTTIIVTGYTGPIHSFGSADTINVTELV